MRLNKRGIAPLVGVLIFVLIAGGLFTGIKTGLFAVSIIPTGARPTPDSPITLTGAAANSFTCPSNVDYCSVKAEATFDVYAGVEPIFEMQPTCKHTIFSDGINCKWAWYKFTPEQGRTGWVCYNNAFSSTTPSAPPPAADFSPVRGVWNYPISFRFNSVNTYGPDMYIWFCYNNAGYCFNSPTGYQAMKFVASSQDKCGALDITPPYDPFYVIVPPSGYGGYFNICPSWDAASPNCGSNEAPTKGNSSFTQNRVLEMTKGGSLTFYPKDLNGAALPTTDYKLIVTKYLSCTDACVSNADKYCDLAPFFSSSFSSSYGSVAEQLCKATGCTNCQRDYNLPSYTYKCMDNTFYRFCNATSSSGCAAYDSDSFKRCNSGQKCYLDAGGLGVGKGNCYCSDPKGNLPSCSLGQTKKVNGTTNQYMVCELSGSCPTWSAVKTCGGEADGSNGLVYDPTARNGVGDCVCPTTNKCTSSSESWCIDKYTKQTCKEYSWLNQVQNKMQSCYLKNPVFTASPDPTMVECKASVQSGVSYTTWTCVPETGTPACNSASGEKCEGGRYSICSCSALPNWGIAACSGTATEGCFRWKDMGAKNECCTASSLCDDGDVTTDDSCDTTTHQCRHIASENSCSATKPCAYDWQKCDSTNRCVVKKAIDGEPWCNPESQPTGDAGKVRCDINDLLSQKKQTCLQFGTGEAKTWQYSGTCQSNERCQMSNGIATCVPWYTTDAQCTAISPALQVDINTHTCKCRTTGTFNGVSYCPSNGATQCSLDGTQVQKCLPAYSDAAKGLSCYKWEPTGTCTPADSSIQNYKCMYNAATSAFGCVCFNEPTQTDGTKFCDQNEKDLLIISKDGNGCKAIQKIGTKANGCCIAIGNCKPKDGTTKSCSETNECKYDPIPNFCGPGVGCQSPKICDTSTSSCKNPPVDDVWCAENLVTTSVCRVDTAYKYTCQYSSSDNYYKWFPTPCVSPQTCVGASCQCPTTEDYCNYDVKGCTLDGTARKVCSKPQGACYTWDKVVCTSPKKCDQTTKDCVCPTPTADNNFCTESQYNAQESRCNSANTAVEVCQAKGVCYEWTAQPSCGGGQICMQHSPAACQYPYNEIVVLPKTAYAVGEAINGVNVVVTTTNFQGKQLYVSGVLKGETDIRIYTWTTSDGKGVLNFGNNSGISRTGDFTIVTQVCDKAPAYGVTPIPICQYKNATVTVKKTLDVLLNAPFSSIVGRVCTVTYQVVDKETGGAAPVSSKTFVVSQGANTVDYEPDGTTGIKFTPSAVGNVRVSLTAEGQDYISDSSEKMITIKNPTRTTAVRVDSKEISEITGTMATGSHTLTIKVDKSGEVLEIYKPQVKMETPSGDVVDLNWVENNDHSWKATYNFIDPGKVYAVEGTIAFKALDEAGETISYTISTKGTASGTPSTPGGVALVWIIVASVGVLMVVGITVAVARKRR